MMQSSTDVIDQPPPPPAKSVRGAGGKSRLRRLKQSDISAGTIRQFRQACGQTAAYIVRISSSKSGSGQQSVLWDRPSLIVGRGGDCDLRLSHAEISRQHAYFQLIGDRIFCADLGSRSGTHWSQGAAQAGWVPVNEPVSLGPYSLTFEPAPPSIVMRDAEGDFDDESLPQDADGDDFGDGCHYAEGDSIFLDFLNAGPQVRRFRVGRHVTLIGSGDGVKIRLSNPTVSNVHCAVVRTPRGLWVVDLLSADGTIVNGNVEPVAPLQSGDEFQVGRFVVAVHYGESDNVDEFVPTHQESNGDALKDQFEEMVHPENDQPTTTPESRTSELTTLNELARIAADRPNSGGVPAPAEGLSEQFVLNIVKELGVMQQQALQHAQQSMRETLNQMSETYQQRVDGLERQHALLRDQLQGLMSGRTDDVPAPRRIGRVEEETAARWESPHEVDEPSEAPLPAAERDVYDDIDPQDREQWIRDQIKTVEAELDKTRSGWGRKLVNMLGY